MPSTKLPPGETLKTRHELVAEACCMLALSVMPSERITRLIKGRG